MTPDCARFSGPQNWLGETDKLDDTHDSRKCMSLENVNCCHTV